MHFTIQASENIFTTASSNGNADTDLPTQGAAWSDVFVKNPVAAIAVSVCVLVILVVGFTLIMRCIKQRKKGKWSFYRVDKMNGGWLHSYSNMK